MGSPRLLATGVLTSPNYPGNYSNRFERTDTIQVEEGLLLSIQFTRFDIEDCKSECACDHLTITDRDGTTLMEKRCGSSLPAKIRSRTNSVNIEFRTDLHGSRGGWSVSWYAVTPTGG